MKMAFDESEVIFVTMTTTKTQRIRTVLFIDISSSVTYSLSPSRYNACMHDLCV